MLDKLHDQGGICGLCRAVIRDPLLANLDHIVPKSRGGSNRLENLQAVHYECNQLKGQGLPSASCLGCRRLFRNLKHLDAHHEFCVGMAASKALRKAARRMEREARKRRKASRR